MKGVTEKSGIPHIWGVPCKKDENYRHSSAELFSLTEWLCPYCQQNLSKEYGFLICLNFCHLVPIQKRKQN